MQATRNRKDANYNKLRTVVRDVYRDDFLDVYNIFLNVKKVLTTTSLCSLQNNRKMYSNPDS